MRWRRRQQGQRWCTFQTLLKPHDLAQELVTDSLIHEREVLQTRWVNRKHPHTICAMQDVQETKGKYQRHVSHMETWSILSFSQPHRATKPCARLRGLHQVCHLVGNRIHSKPNPKDRLVYQCGSVIHENESWNWITCGYVHVAIQVSLENDNFHYTASSISLKGCTLRPQLK